MRVILALAAHFKPGSVRPTNNDNSYGKLERASSTMSLAAEAAVALADASQLASSAGLSLHYKYKYVFAVFYHYVPVKMCSTSKDGCQKYVLVTF